MGAAQPLQGRTLRQLLFIRGVFQGQPSQVVVNALADIPGPGGKQPLGHFVSEPLVDQADDAVHVEIRFPVGPHGQEPGLKFVVPAGGPHQVDGPALLGAVASRLHISR